MHDENDPKHKITRLFEQTASKGTASKAPSPGHVISQSGAGNIINFGNLHLHGQSKSKPAQDDPVDPGGTHISDAQRAKLKALVDDIVLTEGKLKKRPRSYGAVWNALNKHCKVTSYRRIAFEDFEKARTYLQSWRGRLDAMKSAPIKNGDSWRSNKYAYIHANSKEEADAKAMRAYIKRNFGAGSLTELSNDELERVYRYVASRRARKI
ncbi:MAG: ORF6C domain-containing protein [Pelagimonas sp.]|jgi:hypothetical protein|nr:ORF6C domain-containing protein [Pelagimonas sp.]